MEGMEKTPWMGLPCSVEWADLTGWRDHWGWRIVVNRGALSWGPKTSSCSRVLHGEVQFSVSSQVSRGVKGRGGAHKSSGTKDSSSACCLWLHGDHPSHCRDLMVTSADG